MWYRWKHILRALPSTTSLGVPLNRRLSPIVILAALLALLSSTVAGAAESTAPTVEDLLTEQSAEAFEQSLRALDDEATTPISIESVGRTRRGRDILLTGIGDPSNTPVLVISSQHGNEPTGFLSAYELIGRFARGDDDVEEILDELYVLVMPLVNPDGYAYDTRGNTDFEAPPRDSSGCFNDDGSVDPDLLNQGRGVYTTQYQDTDDYSYDVNRFHWADWSDSWQVVCNPDFEGRHFDPEQNPVAEARAVRDVYDRFQPQWVVDVHNQGLLRVPEDADPVANEPGEDVIASVLWPTNEDVADEVVTYSKQLALVMKRASFGLEDAELTRYNGGDYPGIARNAYGLLGTQRVEAGEEGPVGGSILLEISGQSDDPLEPEERARRAGIATELVFATLEATADGSVQRVNPELAELLILPQQESLPGELGAASEPEGGALEDASTLDMTVRD